MDYHDLNQEYGHRGGMWKTLLGVVVTLIALYAVVRSFYSIGQRHSVTPQEVIAEGPAKKATGANDGRVITGYTSSADEMLSGERGTIAPLPVVHPEKADLSFDRNRLNASLQTDIIARQEEVVDLTRLPLARSVEGEPSPELPEVFERGAEEIVAPNALSELSRQIDIAKGNTLEKAEVNPATLAEGLDQPQAHAEAVRHALESATQAHIPPIPEPKPERLTLLTRSSDEGGEVLRVPPPPGQEGQAVAPAPVDAADPFRSAGREDKPLLNIKIPGADKKTTIAPPPPESSATSLRPRSTLHPPQQQAVITPQSAPSATHDSQQRAQPSAGLTEYQVQLAALASPDLVTTRWFEIKRQNMDILGHFGFEILPVVTADGRQLYRLRAGPFADKFAASHVCETLKQRRIDCFVRRR